MPKKLLSKKVWKDAVGAKSKPKRLHLKADKDGLFNCPVSQCDSDFYQTIRGCRNMFTSATAGITFLTKKVEDVFPKLAVLRKGIQKSKRSRTTNIPMFKRDCNFDKLFKQWLCSPVGGLKSYTQSSQISCRVLKFFKFCCQDCSADWEIPVKVIDYCIGSISLLSNFIELLKEEWQVGFAGTIGYMNSISHVLDFRRMDDISLNQAFTASEIYIERVKKTLAKKMRCEWNVLLSVEHLSTIGCWASLQEMQKVVPYHADRFAQILINSSSSKHKPPSHDLSFCSAFLTVVFFLLVKATRPMTFQYLTVTMFKSIDSDGVIDQTKFKTQEKYGFDTLIFSDQVQHIVNGYISCIRPHLNPVCDFILVTKNGTQLDRLGEIFGRLVYQAIGKYINPTRYRQIIETESVEKLTVEEQQILSLDQKHTSFVAKIHYQKLKSRNIATKGKQLMEKLSTSFSQDLEQDSEEIPPAEGISNLTIEQVSNQNGKATESINNAVTEIKQSPNMRRKKVSFSQLEDKFLKLGIQKYGNSWSKILTDPEFKFDSSRKSATLCRRAQICKFF